MADETLPSAESIVKTLAKIFKHQGKREIVTLLESAQPNLEQIDYDNWNGGTYIFALNLEVPPEIYAQAEEDLKKIKELIKNKLEALQMPPGHTLGSVSISASLEEQIPMAPEINTNNETIERIWGPCEFRLFLSHVSTYKKDVLALKYQLKIYGISAFVAHEDVKPTLEWQQEIESALHSMHAFVALLTPDFKSSLWTDQEVGFALCRNIPIIPIRLGINPYGFLAKKQGMPGNLEEPKDLAEGIVDILIKQKPTIDILRDALVTGLEKARSFKAAIDVTSKLEIIRGFSANHLKRISAASTQNSQVKNAIGVSKKLSKIISG